MAKTRRSSRGGKIAPPAYFLSIELENIRCFGPRQRLDLSDGRGRPSQWTVLLGENGTGKTTMLQMLAASEPIPREDAEHDDVVPRFVIHWHLLDGLARGRKGGTADWQIEYSQATGLHQQARRSRPVITALSAFSLGSRAIGYGIAHPSEPWTSVTLCCAYGAMRRMGSGALADRERSDDEATATLFSDDAELINAEEWLLQADYAASKKSRLQAKALRRLEQVRDVLIDILPDVDDIRFPAPKELKDKPLVEFHTPYGWVPLRDLGLGYRTMAAWTVDLASRLFDRYPDSPNPIAEPAAALIDEIDLHLHPRWQREIMQFLSERFVNTQFIVTAHSPLFVQASSGANIAVLRREGDHVVIDQSVQAMHNWRIDQVLTSDLFGLESARPPAVAKALAERTKILGKARITKKDRERLKQLDEQVGALPTGESPEDIEAMAIIRHAAKRLSAE